VLTHHVDLADGAGQLALHGAQIIRALPKSEMPKFGL
jgi:hypothetical protein